MAIATVTTMEVEKVVKVEEKAFQLTLSEAEATTLIMLLNSVGGSPTKSARKYADKIGIALHKAGVYDPHRFGEYLETKGFGAAIYFTENSLEAAERKRS